MARKSRSWCLGSCSKRLYMEGAIEYCLVSDIFNNKVFMFDVEFYSMQPTRTILLATMGTISTCL